MNDYNVDKMLGELQSLMGDELQISADSFFKWLHISPDKLLDLMDKLKKDYGFNYLANLTSVDYGDYFEIVYHLYSIPANHKIGVKTRVPRDQAQVDSLIFVWATADWQEREVYDLMGIDFKGHPNLVRVLLPDDFTGHPLRKDFKMER